MPRSTLSKPIKPDARVRQWEICLLRDFQRQIIDDVYRAWNEGAGNVMLVSPTGSGKTVMLGHIIKAYNAPTCVIAHRQEILGQLALALNREAVPHAIIAPRIVTRQIIAAEMNTHGHSYYSPHAQTKVAGVDTLIRCDRRVDPWYDRVQLVVIDEGHHVLKANKWGKAMGMFVNARGLLPTAHAIRGDGLGLGRNADGLVDRIVIGPSGRTLIDRGFLSDYRICCPKSDVNLAGIHVTDTGEFNYKEVRAAVHASSTITGDVVGAYLKFAPGKLGITFAVDILAATDLVNEYRRHGVPAEIITGKTHLSVRAGLMQQFRERRILQMIAVEVLSEGVDVPAVEVISMARPTNSFQLFGQQCGRPLRLDISQELADSWDSFTDDERLAHIAASSKPRALIIDHVQNTLRHGLPDVVRDYSLNRREKSARGKPDVPMLRSCVECLQPFPRYLTACEHCGHPVAPAGRGSPDAVEGDMVLLDEAILLAMRRQVARVDGPVRIPDGAPPGTVIRNHLNRQAAQVPLRRTIALYGALMGYMGHETRVGQKKFWLEFGIDVMTAQTLGVAEADELRVRIQRVLDKWGVVLMESEA
jgi:DNA repair protein RadD